MAPEKRVYDILSANLDIADKVYIGTPDFNNQTSVTPESLAPWVRITYLPGDAADYADDSRILEYPKVQVDFWVDKTDWDQQEKIETQIYQALHASGWERHYRNSYVDGDTPDLRMTIGYFQFQGLPIG
ncbi:phage tail protein [Lacticaseibacillus paracasei]|uniref:Phage-related head-to-tail joining protein n=1 Tax=Lacticaseibacillus paracasei subsp. paracasei Lpp7 TaxID=1256200 RepID=A0A8E0II44_LACPA|nr:hypothetical protein [Lacticaseibacillus paracasei]EPC53083.1 phage-related head-to-tail joining protein [Lacticaseibacillus paracasei subsp. paracasei Lpp7]